MGRFLLRLLLVPCGYIVGLAAAMILLVGAEWARAYPPVADDPALTAATAAAVATDGFVLYMLIGTAAFLPAMGLILVAEVFSIRSWIFHAGAGAVLALALGHVIGALHPALPGDPLVVLAAGLAGGLGYWLAAGRGSGRAPLPVMPPAPPAA